MKNDTPPVCDYTDSDYQSRFWDQADRAYEDAVEAVALKRLLPKKGRLMLELGAGAGRNTQRYAGFQRVVLVDYSRTQLEQAQERLGDREQYIYVAADIYRLPFVDSLFDGATMIRTLHHMADAPLALSQVRRVLQPGGVFILEYANKHNLKAILRYLLRKQAWNPFDHEPVEFAKLNFDFHPAAIKAWLEAAGFSVKRQLTVSHLRAPLFKRILPLAVLVHLDSDFQLTGNLWQLTPSVFVKAQVEDLAGQAVDPGFFRCPDCGHDHLVEKTGGMQCSNCGRLWPRENGIYDFRP